MIANDIDADPVDEMSMRHRPDCRRRARIVQGSIISGANSFLDSVAMTLYFGLTFTVIVPGIQICIATFCFIVGAALAGAAIGCVVGKRANMALVGSLAGCLAGSVSLVFT